MFKLSKKGSLISKRFYEKFDKTKSLGTLDKLFISNNIHKLFGDITFFL